MDKIDPEERIRRIKALEQARRDMDLADAEGEIGEQPFRTKAQMEAEAKPNPLLVRVFKVPPPDGQYCFQGRPAKFIEVDWFRDERGMMESEAGRSELKEFIEQKIYAKDGAALLVMSPVASFTIDYTAAKNPPPATR